MLGRLGMKGLCWGPILIDGARQDVFDKEAEAGDAGGDNDYVAFNAGGA